MRYRHHYQGLEYIHDTELVLTHIVMGQRNEAEDEAKLPERKGKTHNDFRDKPEQLAAIQKFVFEQTRGWYHMKPLAWAKSEEEANAYKKQFEAEGRINVSVLLIDPQDIIKYA